MHAGLRHFTVCFALVSKGGKPFTHYCFEREKSFFCQLLFNSSSWDRFRPTPYKNYACVLCVCTVYCQNNVLHENETTNLLVLKSWLNNPFIFPAPNKYQDIISSLMDCLVLEFLHVLVQGICYMSKVRQRHWSPRLLSNWMLQGQQCRRTVMWGELCWAGVEVSWTGCFVLHGCSIALIRQGTSQVQIQLWHQAKHTWRGQLGNERSCTP